METYEDRVEHLKALRDLQDRTNGFTAFVLWNFQRGDTPLGKIMNAYERDGKLPKYNKDSSGEEYLRSLAVSRIFLDNFKNFQASWVTQGHEIGQLSLNFGCNLIFFYKVSLVAVMDCIQARKILFEKDSSHKPSENTLDLL